MKDPWLQPLGATESQKRSFVRRNHDPYDIIDFTVDLSSYYSSLEAMSCYLDPLLSFEAMGINIGRARISTGEQLLDLQRDALAASGCDQIVTDSLSVAKASRPGMDEALS